MPCAARPARAQPHDLGARAIVVFEDRRSRGLGRFLRPGFRHCFCLVERPAGWLVCDPLWDRIRLELLNPYPVPYLLDRLARQERRLLLGRLRDGAPKPGTVPGPMTCVEVVKRVLGRPAVAVVTPAQLYRFLRDGAAARPNFVVPGLETLDSDPL